MRDSIKRFFCTPGFFLQSSETTILVAHAISSAATQALISRMLFVSRQGGGGGARGARGPGSVNREFGRRSSCLACRMRLEVAAKVGGHVPFSVFRNQVQAIRFDNYPEKPRRRFPGFWQAFLSKRTNRRTPPLLPKKERGRLDRGILDTAEKHGGLRQARRLGRGISFMVVLARTPSLVHCVRKWTWPSPCRSRPGSAKHCARTIPFHAFHDTRRQDASDVMSSDVEA